MRPTPWACPARLLSGLEQKNKQDDDGVRHGVTGVMEHAIVIVIALPRYGRRPGTRDTAVVVPQAYSYALLVREA